MWKKERRIDLIKLGLLGANIGHSKSKDIYEKLLSSNVEYHLFDYENENEIPSLEKIFEQVQGLSITTPYKKFFLNEVIILPTEITKLNAINCIKEEGSKFYGTNTDYLAIKNIYRNLSSIEKIVLLGDGVMANVTRIAFAELNIPIDSLTRKIHGDLSQLDLSKLYSDNNTLIINSCSRSFFFRGKLPLNSIYWDFNYGITGQKEFIKSLGADYIDGLELLLEQGREALKFWKL